MTPSLAHDSEFSPWAKLGFASGTQGSTPSSPTPHPTPPHPTPGPEKERKGNEKGKETLFLHRLECWKKL